MAPTPFPTTPLYALVTTDMYCGNGVTVPTPNPVRRRLSEEEEATAATTHDRLLRAASTPVEECYAACYQYYAPAPNNAQFLFQLVNPGTGRVCQCCKTCDPVLALQGALLMEACVPNTLLRLQPKLSRRVVKASATRTYYATYTLRMRPQAKTLALRDMGVQITLPANATVVKTKPAAAVTVAGDTVTFYPFDVTSKKARFFKVRVALAPPFMGVNSLVFQAMVFQNTNNLASAPYCSLPATDVAVTVK